jgi:phosphoserine phosphatase RsbU/P
MNRSRSESDAATPSYNELLDRNQDLQRAVEELSLLNDLAGEIGASFNSGYILKRIIDRSRRATDAGQAVISLVDRSAPDPARTVCRAMGSEPDREHYHLDMHLQGWVHHHRRPLLSNRPHEDERLGVPDLPRTVHSVLCVPLMHRMEVMGILSVYNKRGGEGFTEADQRLLGIIAMQSAQVIENARLYEDHQQLERMNEEVRMATEIQQRLLPAAPPEMPGYDLAAKSIPARNVGGDYFDFIPLDDGRMCVALGDVSGKGLPASLLMANLQAALRGQVLSEPSPAACARRVNRMLHCCTAAHLFATLFLGMIDPRTHRAVTCNAGHERPLLFRGGVPLGMLEDFDYKENETMLEPDDLVVLFSDGVTDAESTTGEAFGEQRLIDAVLGAVDTSARGIMHEINDAVRAHAADADPFDDITLLVARRLP